MIKRVVIILMLCMLFSVGSSIGQTQWYKGNTHVHTINSDGDSSPDTVVRWYREHGYHFVVITDHNYLTPIDGLNAVFGAPGKFIVIPGIEVTNRFERKPVHTNGINVQRVVLPQGGASVSDILNNDARAIKTAGGLAQINHPNGGESLGAQSIFEANEIKLFEVCCSDQLGGGDAPSTEEIWDQVLSAGRRIFGVGADDAHSFRGDSTQPGVAWIMVRARNLSPSDVVSALDSGEFYATTGVELKNYEVNTREVKIELENRKGERYRTYFIGKNGKLLKRDVSASPSYQFKGDELYVRARIERGDGKIAWTAPIFLQRN